MRVALRPVLVAAAALVALGTLAYAFAAREAPAESRDAPLEADGARAEASLRDECLSLDVRALDAIEAALRLGCAEESHVGGNGTDGNGAGAPPPLVAPSADPDVGADAPATPTTPSSARPTPPPSGAKPWPTPFLTPRPTPPNDDPHADDADAWTSGGAGQAWWTPPQDAPTWPDGVYDALTPLLSPPRPPEPPGPGAPSEPSPAAPMLERCTNVCDPRELGGAGGPWVRDRPDAGTVERVGLLARALEALDAYVRLRG